MNSCLWQFLFSSCFRYLKNIIYKKEIVLTINKNNHRIVCHSNKYSQSYIRKILNIAIDQPLFAIPSIPIWKNMTCSIPPLSLIQIFTKTVHKTPLILSWRLKISQHNIISEREINLQGGTIHVNNQILFLLNNCKCPLNEIPCNKFKSYNDENSKSSGKFLIKWISKIFPENIFRVHSRLNLNCTSI